MFQILSKDDTLSLIKSVKGRAGRLDTDLQKVAVMCIVYANVHGDVTIAQAALESLGKGQRKPSFVAYLEQHGKMQFDGKTKTIVYRKRDDVATDVGSVVEALADTHWVDAKKDPEIQSMYDVEAMVAALVKRIEKLAAVEGTTIKSIEKLDVLRALADSTVEVALPMPELRAA
jgi:hypothetical protein